MALCALILAPSMAFASATPLVSAVDWKPSFQDPPVPAEYSAKIAAALPEVPIVPPRAERRVLIFSATACYRHASIPTGKEALSRMGELTGAYETVVSDDPANFEKAALGRFDAVILLNPSLNFFMPAEQNKDQFSAEAWAFLEQRHHRLVDNLVKYVEQGGGLVGVHSATYACYDDAAFGRTIGGYFAGHPWLGEHRVTIVVEDPEHATIQPVFGALKDFELIEEIYQFEPEPYSRERLRILLHLDPERSQAPHKAPGRADDDYAVSWVQSIGEGRVFYTSLGHNHHIYWNPLVLKHYLAGIQFATGDLDADTTPSAQIAVPNLDAAASQTHH